MIPFTNTTFEIENDEKNVVKNEDEVTDEENERGDDGIGGVKFSNRKHGIRNLIFDTS